MMKIELPEPEPEQRAQSLRLQAELRREIEAQGPLPFDRYMERVLYAPGLGYYSAGATKFGPAGDFITAPELGELFGRTLARALAPTLAAWPDAEILELGAGSGALARVVLTRLAELGALPKRYRILEPSAELRQRQVQLRSTLAAPLAARLDWLEAPPTRPWCGILLANEVLDALPVARYVWRRARWWEIAVDVAEARFVERLTAPRSALAELLESRYAALRSAWPEGYGGELCLLLAPWLRAVTAGLERGLVLWIDYGGARAELVHPQRRGGTLRVHYRQRVFDDPYWWPGLCDLTADVDFTAVAEAGEQVGLETLGWQTQAEFLLGAGLLDELGASAEHATARQYALAQEVKRLTLPGAMGERFHVLVQARGLGSLSLAPCLRHPGRRARL